MTGSGHGTLHVRLNHKNKEYQTIIKKAIFGNDHGENKEHGVNNIHSIIQGKMNLKKRSDGDHEIEANHIHHHDESIKHHAMIYATSDKKRNDGQKHGLRKTRLRIGWEGSRKSTNIKDVNIKESYLNESWFRDLKGYLHRKIHPKGYNKLLRIYIEKVNKYKQKANKGLIIRDIIKPYGPNASAREFINYINDLVKKGMLPQKFKA